ncbi:hypothetical protein [Desulfoluna butyratoxydans]|uniref:Uncharacterized protein n=1 Tax=Desulfoluna butyratoxydans TaxID=231438 RepID=A0A4U8YKF1_9BACT|nr:hypothetical protein [Desulfoluna butyratoxydans]VFQ43844.1 hypothetical protein MSL71_14850 [Desulfoluna butyratoxydans]
MNTIVWNNELSEGFVVDNAKGIGCDIKTKPSLDFPFDGLYYEPEIGNAFKVVKGGAFIPLTSEEINAINLFISGYAFPDEPVHVVDLDGVYRGLVDTAKMEEGDKAVHTAPPSEGHIWRDGAWQKVEIAVREDGTWEDHPTATDIYAIYFTKGECSPLPSEGFKWNFKAEAFYDARDLEKTRYEKSTDIRNVYEAKNWQTWGKFIPQYEMETWRMQESEALAFEADAKASTPFLDALIANRADLNVSDKAALVEEVLSNATSFKKILAKTMAEEFNLLTKVKNATSLAELDLIEIPTVTPRWQPA